MCDLSGQRCRLISGLQNCLAEKKCGESPHWFWNLLVSVFGRLSLRTCSEQTYGITVASCVNEMFLAADVISCPYRVWVNIDLLVLKHEEGNK